MAYNRIMSRYTEALKYLSGISLDDAIPRKHEGILGIVEDTGKSTFAEGAALYAPSVAEALESRYYEGKSRESTMGLIAAACIDIALLTTRAGLAAATFASLAVLPSPLAVLPLCAFAGLNIIERSAALGVADIYDTCRRRLTSRNRI